MAPPARCDAPRMRSGIDSPSYRNYVASGFARFRPAEIGFSPAAAFFPSATEHDESPEALRERAPSGSLLVGTVVRRLAADGRDRAWAAPVIRARTWLAAVGWRRHALLGIEERPRDERPPNERGHQTLE